MEAFSIEQLGTSLGQPTTLPASSEVRQQLESLGDAARNLRQVAEGAASYLAQVEALTDGLGK